MPFAKVGAMPQPSTAASSKSNNGRGSGGSKQHRPKGITMEDLKKQTALRLAQEQNHINGDLSQASLPNASLSVPLSGQPHQPQPQDMPLRGQLYPRNDAYHGDGFPSNPYPSQHQSPLPPSMIGNPPHQHHTSRSSSFMRYVGDRPPSAPINSQYPPSSLVQQHPGGYSASGHRNGAGGGSHSAQRVVGDYPQRYESMQQTRPGSSHGVEQRQAPGSSTVVPSTNNAAKNKLPHGLTVHELKEMTKARLQAEAAEKMDGELLRDRGLSPLDFEPASAGVGSRERALSRDSAGRSNPVFHQNESSGTGIPYPVDGYSRPLSHSPSHRQVPRTDTWDSASVASYNSNTFSENLGSEVGLDTSFDVGSNRSRSFTVPALSSAENSVTRTSWQYATPGSGSRGAIATSSFDATVGGNRRRAVTLSPGTGSILEDRPHHGTWTGERLQLPSLGSSIGQSAPSRQRVYSPMLENLGLDGPFSRDHGISENAAGANLFGSMVSDFKSSSVTSSEITRGSNSTELRVPAPPPGFSDSSFDTVAGINQERLATFSPHENVRDGIIGDDKNPWGPNQRNRLATVENLSTDLGSILDLSGSSRQDRNRANTYTYGSSLSMSVPNSVYSDAEETGHKTSFRY